MRIGQKSSDPSRQKDELETAARIAGHDSTRTTQIYDRSEQEITLDEIKRIHI